MRKQLLNSVAIVAGCICGAPALAADLPVKAPRVAAVAPAFSWSGCYVTGNVGYGIFARTMVDYGEDFSYGNEQINDWAFTAGAGLGCNFQNGSFVYGLEGDWNWTNFNKTFTSTIETTKIFKAKWDWYSTLRTRFGIASERTLFFATAGVAIAKVKYHTFYDNATCADERIGDAVCFNKTQFGLTAGVGAEYAVTNNVSMRAEYLALYFPTKWNTTNNFEVSWTSYAHIVRYGLVYRWGDGPVVARY